MKKHLLDYVKPIKCCNYDCTVKKVVKKTDWEDVSSVVICDDDGNIFGILSEEDIVNAEKEDKKLKSIRAWELCTHDMVIASPESSIEDIARLMVENKIHHVVIGKGDKKKWKGCKDATGIISSLDIVEYLLDVTADK
jgi:CBS domain-containing protein